MVDPERQEQIAKALAALAGPSGADLEWDCWYRVLRTRFQERERAEMVFGLDLYAVFHSLAAAIVGCWFISQGTSWLPYWIPAIIMVLFAGFYQCFIGIAEGVGQFSEEALAAKILAAIRSRPTPAANTQH